MGEIERSGASTRTYSQDDILRLKFILKLKGLGISLREGKKLADIFDIHQKDFSKITPKLIQLLDTNIAKIDKNNGQPLFSASGYC